MSNGRIEAMSSPARYAVCIRTRFGRDVRGYFNTLEQAEAYSHRYFPNVWIEDSEAAVVAIEGNQPT